MLLTIFDAMLWWLIISTVYIIYFYKMISYLISWVRISAKYPQVAKSVSIIVPFRNEQQNLDRLVKGLAHQKGVDFEVIFVNDHSEDNSEEQLLSSLKNSQFNYKILHLSVTQGKKAALTLGIENAQNEIIITTDADCYMGKNWMETLIGPFEQDQIQMVAGPVGFIQRGLLSEMLSIELLSLIGVSAATIQQGEPTMANGANLSFRKSIFDELNGYEGLLETPSGDDELFMRKVQLAYPNSVRFCKNEEALVVTEPPANWSDVLSQKIRWASKWNKGHRPKIQLLAFLIGLLQISQIGAFILMLLSIQYLIIGFLLLFSRYLIEFTLTYRVSRDVGLTRPSIGVFTLSFIIYPFYALYIALVANFGSYTWKGRQYK